MFEQRSATHLPQLLPEMLFTILLHTGDPVDLLQMQRVCRALKTKLQGGLNQAYWQFLLKRDFPKVKLPEQNIDYRRLYQNIGLPEKPVQV